MKIRILIMNGQRLVQIEHGIEWNTERVEAASGVKPGIYNIYSATTIDKTKSYDGPVIFVDKEHIYQKIGSTLVKHRVEDFEKLPAIGERTTVNYDDAKAVVAKSSIKHGRRISS
jgi:hypothetical protein